MLMGCLGDEYGMVARKQSMYVYFFLELMTSQLVLSQLQLTLIMDLLNPEGWGHTVLGREAHQVSRLLRVDSLSRWGCLGSVAKN